MANQTNDNVNTFIPEFLHQFQCIGSQCENTCCQHWSIVVSPEVRTNIESYLQNKQDPMVPIHEYFEPNQNNFLFKLDKQGNCPFLTEQKLCQLHASEGEQILPNVCQEFPRKNLRYGHSLLLSASISCPEIARKVLLAPNSLSFVENIHTTKKMSEYYQSDTPELELAFKQTAFNILNNLKLNNNEEKLCALVLLFNLVAQAIANAQPIEELLSDFEHELENGNIASATAQYEFSKPNYSLLVETLAKPFFNLPNPIYSKYYRLFVEKLKDKRYILAAQQGYQLFSQQHENVYCQFLRHWIYHNHFNLKSSNDVYYQIATLVFQTNYMRTLIGFEYPLTAVEKQSTLITDIFHSTARGYAHNRNINLIVRNELQKLNLDSPVSLLILSKF